MNQHALPFIRELVLVSKKPTALIPGIVMASLSSSLYDLSAAEHEPVVALVELPADFLRMMFVLLEFRDLCSAACCCRLWRSISGECWEGRALRRWKFWHPDRWDQLKELGEWQRLYSIRHRLDTKAIEALDNMPWPLKREESLSFFKNEGTDCHDCLKHVAVASGPLDQGRRYWAWVALTKSQVGLAANGLSSLAQSTCEQATAIEKGALLLAQVHYPASDLTTVTNKLDALGAEALRRMSEAGCSSGRQALEIVGTLLFGPSAQGISSDLEVANNIHGFLPAPKHGLGLKGNQEDYYCPHNSLLNDVLDQRLGIPITLAIVHQAVAGRAGLAVDLIGMPRHLISRYSDPSSDEQFYIDSFHAGRIIPLSELRDYMAGLGIHFQPDVLKPLPTASVFERLCANLIDIYQNRRDYEKAKHMLDLVTAVKPHATEYLSLKSRIDLAVKDYSDALLALRQLRQVLMAQEADIGRRRFMEVQLLQSLGNVEEMQAQYQDACVAQKLRPASVRFRVGCLVRHVRYHYRGLVYDWDPVCNVDENWMQQMGVDSLPGGRAQPFYRVLVDVRDRPFQSTYVAQCNVELIEDAEAADLAGGVQHPQVGEFFDGLPPGGAQYVPSSYLRYRFPQDWDDHLGQD